ncbi:MAG: aspartyl-tRNA(Asn)/glutamyl-tRNA(Gln) amidotransferase subunit A [bacterium]|jgi:aspartyl-tRNA(Asn)/glutamyl-tRNA(Gln) amidotransferase subunit A
MSLYSTPIHKLHEMRLKGEITTLDIAQSVLKRIEEVEGTVKAYLSLAGEQVLEQAKAIDAKIANGETVSPLAGMPIAIKDIFNIKGTKTTCASKMLENYVSPYDSTVTQKLSDAEYNLVGKTNMDEFAMGSSTENSAFYPTKNPWNLDCVPGGSSGGSGASVAAGTALASLGTDTGGSIRQPASFNGIVGVKPTYGRVSRYGMVAFASSLDQAGPMTQDVEDAALIMNAIAGYDEKDATSLNVDVPDYTQFLNKDIKGMKIGLIKELDLSQCDADVIQIFEKNIESLKSAGAEIVEISLPNISHAVATYYVLAPSEASSNLGRYDGVRYGLRAENPSNLQELYEESREQGFGPEVKRRILLGTFTLSSGYYDAYYLKAQKIQNLIRHQFNQAFKSVDAIATPVSPTPAFKLGEKVADPLQMYLIDAFTIPANLAGIPGMSIPAGFTSENLPVGLQLLGKHLDEGKLFQIAHAFEREIDLQSPPLAL